MKLTIYIALLLAIPASAQAQKSAKSPTQMKKTEFTEITFSYQKANWAPNYRWAIYADGRVLHMKFGDKGEERFYGNCDPEIFNRLSKILKENGYETWETEKGWPITDGPNWLDPVYVGTVQNNKRRNILSFGSPDQAHQNVTDEFTVIFNDLKVGPYPKKRENSQTS